MAMVKVSPSTLSRRVSWPVTTIILALHLAALLGFFYISWSSFWLFCALCFITNCLGISLGMHRLFT
ncbi:MAG: hypothetical protein OXC40_06525, partial [Proteobacteria bacterium]|nr:hypothetical protein [Pseudomonadota bacterium]